ncbi:MAG: YfhO family protein [Lachnospiraceae bacterium]|nr:YfhO family protein [Lachnospiraceae bacterium]
MIAVFAILGIYPFGEDTIMTGDTTYQLVDYLSYYKTIFFGNNDFTYSMSKNMGGEMAGFAAYYLFSPLNLLTLPFPRKYLFAGIELIIALVPGLASLSMCFSLRQLRKDKEGALLFALCYGLSAYIIVYNELLYYYTNIILLPLIFLFLRRLTESRDFFNIGYILLLAFTVINNYYTGYMICLFLFIYIIYYLFGLHKGTEHIRIFFRFAVNSLTAVCLSCFTLIPAVMSLSGEKNNFSIGLYLTFPPLAYFSKLYSGSFAGDFGAGMPNIYCGIIISLLLIVLLFNKDSDRRFRISTGFLLLFFWVDFFINTLNVVWHGLNQPIGFPYRQAFTVVFFCIVTAYEYTDFSVVLPKKFIVVISGIFILYSAYGIIKGIDTLSFLSVSVSAVILILLMILLSFPVKNRVLLLCIVTMADLVFNAGYSLSHFYFTTVDEYQEPLAMIGNAVAHVKDQGDTDLYRTEKMFRRTNNDAMMFDYAGLSHFSSSEKKSTIEFLGKLGFRDNGNWAMYTGINTALADSLLGIRYTMSPFDSTGKPYDQVYADKEGECFIYNNTYALPLVSAANKSIFNVDLTDDPFDNQNKLADAITGNTQNVLYLQKASRYDNDDGSVSFDIHIENKGVLYCFFTAPDLQDVTLYLDGYEWTDYFKTYDWATVDLQERTPGEIAHVDLRSNNEDPVTVDEGCFAVIDYNNLINWSNEVRDDKTLIYKKTSSYLEGTYNTDKDTILFSIPIDKGWHIYVDK